MTVTTDCELNDHDLERVTGGKSLVPQKPGGSPDGTPAGRRSGGTAGRTQAAASPRRPAARAGGC